MGLMNNKPMHPDTIVNPKTVGDALRNIYLNTNLSVYAEAAIKGWNESKKEIERSERLKKNKQVAKDKVANTLLRGANKLCDIADKINSKEEDNE